MSEETRGKVSVSMSDELQQRADQYAKDHQLTFSQVVQTALEQFLKGGQPDTPPTPPPPPPPPPPAGGVDQVAREYVLALAAEVDMMRTSMQNAGLWVPPVLGPPPWYHPRSPGDSWPPAPPSA